MGVDYILQKLGFHHARTTIPKWLQRGVMDPLDKVLSVLIKKLGTALQDEKDKKGRDKEEHWGTLTLLKLQSCAEVLNLLCYKGHYCTTLLLPATVQPVKFSLVVHCGTCHSRLWLKRFAPFLISVYFEQMLVLFYRFNGKKPASFTCLNDFPEIAWNLILRLTNISWEMIS